MKDVVIVAAVRTAIGKAPRGALRTTRPDDLAAYAINGALERVTQLDRSEIEDVILGCAMPEAEQGLNIARVASFRAGLPVDVLGDDDQSVLLVGAAVDRDGGRIGFAAAVQRRSWLAAWRACRLCPWGATSRR